MATPANSICFKEAREMRVWRRIGYDDHLKHIVAHYGGVRHDTDAEGQWPWIPTGFEEEVRKIVLGRGLQPLDERETTVLHGIFLGAFEGNVATVKDLVGSSTLASELYLRPLVAIAQDTGSAQLLRYCLELGFRPTGYLDDDDILSCRCHNKPSTAWLDVLYDYDFRKWRSDPHRLNEWETWHYVFNMGPDCTRWWIDHGGRTSSARGLFEHSAGWPKAPTFRALLDEFGIDWFKNSGTLQLAVKKKDTKTVKMLVEAGAPMNEDVDDWNFDVRERRAAPLSALHEAIYAKSEDMIRYLVDHGAKIPRKDFDDPYNTTPEEFKPYQRLVSELSAVE